MSHLPLLVNVENIFDIVKDCFHEQDVWLDGWNEISEESCSGG